MRPLIAPLAAIVLVSLLGSPARASDRIDPSGPRVECAAARPAPGQAFDGVVLHIFADGSFCVAQGPTPADWIAVKLPGGPLDRRVLMAATFAKHVTCVASAVTDAAVTASCNLSGADLRQLTADPDVAREALAWR